MKLPFDILSKNYTKPRLFLCETDKQKICQLETISLSGTFKFNAYSELNFSVGRTYTDMVTGETLVNPFYNKIEALRLVFLEGFGYFEIQDPEIESDGIKEVKNVTAYSLEYTLSQKYIENFKVNTGEVDSLEVIEAAGNKVSPITLINNNKNLSLLDLALEKIYGWKIGHIDNSLKSVGRQFEISRTSVYDFIIQDICEKFNCYAVFDTIENKINLYAEALVSKYIGNGETNTFTLISPYDSLGTVSIDGYKTTKYAYNPQTGVIVFDEIPKNGARIEITDGSQEQWKTDVYVSFDNLAQEVNVSYSAEDIKTVLTVKGQDDLDIREVNMGIPYIVDLSYYHSVDWMGQDLYDAYTNYLKVNNDAQSTYTKNAKKMIEVNDRISYLTNMLSLQYELAPNVTSSDYGIYYIKGGTDDSPYYKEVKLPDEYKANIAYYKMSEIGLNEEKFNNLYKALQTYFISEDLKDVSELEKLVDDFKFAERIYEYASIEYLIENLSQSNDIYDKETEVDFFLDFILNELGRTPLESLYLKPYKAIMETNKEAGWDDTSNENYWRYYTVSLIVASIEGELMRRENAIDKYEQEYEKLQKENSDLTKNASIYNVFTHEQLIRLSPFLREDEYTDDNFLITDSDTTDIIIKTKQELFECGRIELAKLCEPKLSFSMDMANIYALVEFDPIINQFQLGKLINVAIRDDYVKRARLLAVDINFDDFSDFSCEFGELTNIKTPSSIHADLLASALTAGKSVASNESHWNDNINRVDEIEIQLENALANAVLAVKNNDGTQHIDTSKYGIRLQKYDVAGNLEPEEGWIVNNQFLYSDDNFKTAKTVFGKYTVDGQDRWGLVADAVLAGRVDSSDITGGTIKIGKYYDANGNDKYTFEVDDSGNVTMNGANSIHGYATTSQLKVTDDAISAEVTRATKSETELSSKITVNANSIAAEVTRAKNSESSLSSKIEINANAITSKVSSGDFGTLIEQNYNHVKIAWNKNSNYIKFENAELNVYNTSNTLLMKMNYNGANYYYNGTKVGKIGTNYFKNSESYRGLVFDLEADASFMCWSAKNNASDGVYDVKLMYYHKDVHYKKGLHFLCNAYADGYLYLDNSHRFVKYTNDVVGYDGPMIWVNSSNDSSVKIDGAAKTMDIYGGTALTAHNDVKIDIYSNVYMHNFDIYDADMATSSDARLKTNISETSVDALGLINQIEMKEFDWIENNKHEDIGMIAQQLKNIMPNLVCEDEKTGRLFIKTNKFIPYLIKAIQELTDYISNGASVLSNNKWNDPYTIDEKNEFVKLAYTDANYGEKEILEEVPCETLSIPINNIAQND